MREGEAEQTYTGAADSTAQAPTLDEAVERLRKVEAAMPDMFQAIVCPVEQRAEIERAMRCEPAASIISPGLPMTFGVPLYFYTNPLERNQIIRDLKAAGIQRIALIVPSCPACPAR
jgi:hypothetical protein